MLLAGASPPPSSASRRPGATPPTRRGGAGTLTLTGNAASDKLVAAPRAGRTDTLQVDVGEDGTADFSFDRSTFTAIDVEAGARRRRGPHRPERRRVHRRGRHASNGGAGDDTLRRRRRRRHASSAAPATTSSTATSAPTRRSLGTRRRPLPVGSRRRQRHRRGPGRQRPARLQRLQRRRDRSTSPPNGAASALTRNVAAITMDLDGSSTSTSAPLGGADIVTVGDLAGTDVEDRRRRPRRDRRRRRRRGRHRHRPRHRRAPTTSTLRERRTARRSSTASAPRRASTGGEAALDDVGVADARRRRHGRRSAVGVTGPIPVHVDGGDGADTARYNGTDRRRRDRASLRNGDRGRTSTTRPAAPLRHRRRSRA